MYKKAHLVLLSTLIPRLPRTSFHMHIEVCKPHIIKSNFLLSALTRRKTASKREAVSTNLTGNIEDE